LVIKSKITFDRILPILESEKEITIKESLWKKLLNIH
jgi:hypothetical protein